MPEPASHAGSVDDRGTRASRELAPYGDSRHATPFGPGEEQLAEPLIRS